MFTKRHRRQGAGPERSFWLIVALAALLGVLGAGIHGGIAVFAEAAEQTNPYAEVIAEGKALYLEAGCYACHGTDARGRGRLGPGLTDLKKTDAEIFDFVMESYKGKATGVEMWKIITYLRSLAEHYTPEYRQADCLFCHEQKEITPTIVKEWRNARDGEPTNTECIDCHGSNHEVIIRSKGRVPVGICAECHAKRYEESLSGGGHAIAHSLEWFQRFVRSSPKEVMAISYSVGHEVAHRCTSCHSRHTFSKEEAKDPRTCGVCHSGPEHPEMEAYMNSKHGLIWKLEGTTGRAPTCVTCHMPDGNHNVSGIVIYGSGIKKVENQPFSPEHKRKRALQITLCAQCHSERFAKEQLEMGDRVYSLTQAAFEEAVSLVKALYEDGILDPMPGMEGASQPFDKLRAPPGKGVAGKGEWNPTVEGGQLYYDLSEIEQRLFRLDYLWRGLAWKSAFHGDLIGPMWNGWYKIQEELSFIRSEARRLRRLHALEKALGVR